MEFNRSEKTTRILKIIDRRNREDIQLLSRAIEECKSEISRITNSPQAERNIVHPQHLFFQWAQFLPPKSWEKDNLSFVERVIRLREDLEKNHEKRKWNHENFMTCVDVLNVK